MKEFIEQRKYKIGRVGDIVVALTELELQMDIILSNYFAKKEKMKEFMAKILGDESCSMAAKIRFMNRIGLLEEKGLKIKLNRLLEIRNLVAHSSPMYSEKNNLILHAIKQEPLDLEKLYEEYISINKIVFSKIVEINMRLWNAPK